MRERVVSVAAPDSKWKKPLRPLAAILLISMVVPANFYLGSILLTPSRIVTTIVVPFLLVRLFSGAYGGVLLNDILIVIFLSLATISMFVNNFDLAPLYSGLQWMSIFGGYVVARATIRSVDDFRAFVRLYAVIVVIFLPFAAYESITSQFIIPKLIEALPGVTSVSDVNYERRLGLDRAQVVFSHPILYGAYCSMLLGIYFIGLKDIVSVFKRHAVLIICLMNCIFAVSSGPLISAIAQVGLIGYGFVTKSIEKQWRLLMAGMAVLYVAVELYSPYPAVFEIARRLAFNSSTMYNRVLILQYGSAQIAKTPWLGIGLNDWERPIWMKASIDNHWILMGVQFGLPALILLFAIFLNSLLRAGGGRFRRGSELYKIRLAWNIVLVSIILTFTTVAMFGEVVTMVFFILGAGAFLFYAREDEVSTNAPAVIRPKRRTVFGDGEVDDDKASRPGDVTAPAQSKIASAHGKPPLKGGRTVLR